MKTVRLACQAMATRFEIVMHGPDQVRLRAAGEEAVAEIKRLHQRLNAFDPKSWIGRLNRRTDNGPIRLAAELFYLLQRVNRLSEVTLGAFDVTVGPLLELWGLRGEVSRSPAPEAIEAALGQVGMHNVELSKRQRTITFGSDGMRLDLGAVGKGYALDVATEILLSAGIESALLHGGTSSVRVIGADRSGDPWRIAVGSPQSDHSSPIGTVALVDEAMSVSAISGRVVELAAGSAVGHVIDPRSGQPIASADLAVAVAPTATAADALSTGLLVLGESGIQEIQKHVVGFRGALVQKDALIQDTETILVRHPET